MAATSAVRCSKCGEELLGAVNRCWKCGQQFAVPPQNGGVPPPPPHAVASEAPLDAVVLDDDSPAAAAARAASYEARPSVAPRGVTLAKASTAARIDAQRKRLMAMGGTVGSLVLAAFALIISWFRFEAVLIAALGMAMGVWGLQSARRNWALVGMLLCWLAIGLGTYTGARQLYIYIQKSRPPEIPDNRAFP